MKFNDLKKWQKLLIYMYTHNVNDTFTVAKYGDDVIKHGIVKNKNALYSMINDLREKSYIFNPGDGYLLSNIGWDYLYHQLEDWLDSETDFDSEIDENCPSTEQPNSFENSPVASANDSMKTAFESMAKSFEAMSKSFAALSQMYS